MQPALSLYRRLLRLHRQKLPVTKRSLGDAYLKKEFRDHRNASPQFVNGFMAEWKKYADELEKRGDVSRDLSDEILITMSPEKKAMLEKLKRSTRGL